MRTQTSSPPELDFDRMFEQLAPTVARWIARLGGPDIEPADLVQEVFIVAYRRRFDLRPDVKPTTWLFGITLRIVQSERRRQRLRRWLSRAATFDLETVRSRTPSPTDELDARLCAVRAYRALDAMSERHRTAFILFELEGLSVEQIAELLGARTSTIKVWLHRARSAFIAHVMRDDVHTRDAINEPLRKLPGSWTCTQGAPELAIASRLRSRRHGGNSG